MSAGLAGQIGWKSESTWGTAVTPDLFHAGYLNGNPVREQPPLVSKGIRAGRRLPTAIAAGAKTVEGQFEFELYASPMATLLRHLFGTIATTGTNPYTHTASLGPLNSKSLTIQVGIPGTGGTVHPFTYSGCKVPEWTLKGVAGEYAKLEASVSAKDYVTATALATATYLSSVPFTFVQGSVSIAGVSQANVEEFALNVKRPLRIQHPIGSATIMEQFEEGQAEAEITCKARFSNLTLHDLNNTAVAVVLAFTDGTHSLTVTSNAWVVPATPELEGADAISEFEFKAIPYGSTDAAGVTAVLINAESSST